MVREYRKPTADIEVSSRPPAPPAPRHERRPRTPTDAACDTALAAIEQKHRAARLAQREQYKRDGKTRHGIPKDYDGSDPTRCNARTTTGRPCRAKGLSNGRCKWHGGLSTGPTTPEGKAKAAAALNGYRAAMRQWKADMARWRHEGLPPHLREDG